MKTIICIPGLGGRSNYYREYKNLLSQFNLEFFDVVNWKEAQKAIDGFTEKQEQVIFLTNCYGIQFALRAIDKYPSKVAALIVIEPFFGEFFPFKKAALLINKLILGFMRFTDKLGLKRTKFPEVDYYFVERQPLFFQPFYDVVHQSMTDYFEKTEDILTYQPPEQVRTKTFLIFSPKGFVRDPKKRQRFKDVFINSDMAEVGKNTHNIVTLSTPEIAEAIRNWLTVNISS